MPFYAVAEGLKPGIFSSWNECSAQVTGYKGAKHKKFATLKEAQLYLASHQGSSIGSSFSSLKVSKPLSTTASRLAGTLKSNTSYQPSRSSSSSTVKSSSAAIVRLNASTASNKIYVDGACRGNGKSKLPASGYGVYYGPQDPRNEAVSLDQVDDIAVNKPTNNRAELFAAKHALSNIVKELESGVSRKYIICTDSQYTMQALTKWADKWSRNGWKTGDGKDVLNKDVILNTVQTMKLINARYREKGWGDLQFEYVKGHAGIEGNEQADRLANLGADEMKSV